MTFGLTAEGFTPKTLRDILDDVETDMRAEIDPALDTSTVSPDGQRNAILARQAALVWELAQECNDGLDPDKAEGAQLVGLCKLTGTVPHAATYSEADCTCNLTSGTTLRTGVHFVAVDGRPDILFTPKADYTAATNGAQTVRFRAQTAGPVAANAGTLTVIATTETGWSSCTNPADAELGQEADTDAELRARREAELAAAGSCTTRAIRAAVLQVEENGASNVLECLVLENDSEAWDFANSLPPHSIEVIAYDSPQHTDTVIAQAVWENKPAGTSTQGSVTANATDPDTGELVPVKFSRPTAKNIYVTFDLTTGSGYVGDAAFKTAVVAALRAAHGVGDDVLHWTCQQVAAQTGVLNVVSIKLGFTAAPASSADLTIAAREIAAFDTARIVIT
jgi:hypothetical protein